MPTLPMTDSPRSWLARLDLDPAEITRSTTELATRDLPELIHRADVPQRLETGMDAAADAIRTAVERIPGRQRRSPRAPWVPGLALVSVLTMLAVTGWWIARSAADSRAREIDREFDEDTLERATNEGMLDVPPAAATSDGTGLDSTAAAPGATLDPAMTTIRPPGA